MPAPETEKGIGFVFVFIAEYDLTGRNFGKV
jgi:hypothetical protein